MSGRQFELEPYDPSRREEYLALLGDAWGGGAMGGETFDWWFDGNPAGSLRSVAVRDGRVVGAASHSLYRMLVGGQERLGQLSVHAVTDPGSRGLGIFRALEVRHEELGQKQGSVCVLAFASKPTHPLFLGPLGWTQIDRRRAWARVFPRGDASGVAPVDRFGERHEAVNAALAPRLGNHLVRDAAYLNWRYLDAPRPYNALEAPGGGYAVVGYTERRGRRLGLVMELLGESAEVAALLRGALSSARGTTALVAVPSPVLTRSILARHGFAPTPYRLDFMGKGLAEPLDARSSAWSVSFGDTDFL